MISGHSNWMRHRLKTLCVAWAKPNRLAVGIALAAILTCYCLIGRCRLSGDMYAYAETAQCLLQGKSLYSGVWQDKPLLALLFYVPVEALFPRSAMAIQAWLFFWIVLQGVMVRIVVGAAKVSSQIVAYALMLVLPLQRSDYSWASTEHVSNLWVVVLLFSAYRLVRDQQGTLWVACLAGFAAICAFNTRQNTILYAAVPVLAMLVGHGTRARKAIYVSFFLAGSAIAAALIFALVICVADLIQYYDTLFQYPRRYAAATAITAEATIKILVKLTRFVLTNSLLFICCLYGAVLFATSSSHQVRSATRVRLVVLTAVLIGGCVCVAPLKPYDHYWVNLFPPIALLAFSACELSDERCHSLLQPVGRGVLAALLTVSVWQTLERYRAEPALVKPIHEVAEETNRATRPGDTLYVLSDWIESSCLCHATLALPAHRFFWCMQLDPYWSTILAEPIASVIDDYVGHSPTLLLVKDEMLDVAPQQDVDNKINVVRQNLRENKYDRIFSLHGFSLYRLREAVKDQ